MRIHDIAEKGRVAVGRFESNRGDLYGHFRVKAPSGALLFIIACDGEWEHVSVSVRGNNNTAPARCPTWEEMCWVKGLFWVPEDCVVQFHPPQSQYVNDHDFVLHLWKWAGGAFPMPPKEAV